MFITGCWDRKELEERNFVLAVAIDTADVHKPGIKPEQGAEVKRVETFVQPYGDKRYCLSLQLLKLSPGGEGKDKSKTYVISNTGDSIFEMIRDMLGQSRKSLWFEHLQVIIISEAVLKEARLAEILDFFIRDSEMRSRIRLYVTSGEARTFLEYIPPSKEAGGIYLESISSLNIRNSHITGERTDFGYTIQYFDHKSNVALPRIEMAEKVVKMGGVAIFKKDRFIGYIDEYATAGARFMTGSEKSAIITIPCPNHPEHQVVFELYRHDTRLRPHVEGDSIYFTLDITMYGNLGELQGTQEMDDTMDLEYIKKLEVAFAEEIKRNVLYTNQVFQKEFRVDAIGQFAGKLKAYEPDAWAKIKDQWEEMYPDIPLIVSVNVLIKNIGNHK